MFVPGDTVVVSKPWRADSPMAGRNAVVVKADSMIVEANVEGIRDELNPVPFFIRELTKIG